MILTFRDFIDIRLKHVFSIANNYRTIFCYFNPLKHMKPNLTKKKGRLKNRGILSFKQILISSDLKWEKIHFVGRYQHLLET